MDEYTFFHGSSAPPEMGGALRRSAVRFDALGETAAPERDWLVEGLIPTGAVTFISGDGGLGKSLLGQQLVTAAALGVPWLGRKTAQVGSVSLFCEDDAAEIHRRAVAIAAHYGVSPADPRLGGAHFLARAGAHNRMIEFYAETERGSGRQRVFCRTTQVYDELLEWAVAEKLRLVLLDSLHEFFLGNENNRSQAKTFVNELTIMAREIRGAVVVLAHPSIGGIARGSGTSGSTAWNNAVRSRLYLTRAPAPAGEANDDVRMLTTVKANFGRLGRSIRITWRDGVFIADPPPDLPVAEAERLRCERAFLEALSLATAQGRAVSEHRNAPNFAPTTLRDYPPCRGINARELGETMRALFAAGRIEKRRVGRKPNRHAFVTLAPVERPGGAA